MIVIEEDVLFNTGKGYNWAAWEDKRKLPIGLAALAAFLVGYAGSVISMDQTWFLGPIAKLVVDYGAGLGIWVGTGWAMVIFPPLRWLELKKIRR
jgi:purine-cytosine permease-like protein